MKEVFIDVMSSSGRFIFQVKLRYCAAFPISNKQVEEEVYKKRPSLRGKDIRFNFSNQKIIQPSYT